jgi:hypothetical protein
MHGLFKVEVIWRGIHVWGTSIWENSVKKTCLRDSTQGGTCVWGTASSDSGCYVKEANKSYIKENCFRRKYIFFLRQKQSSLFGFNGKIGTKLGLTLHTIHSEFWMYFINCKHPTFTSLRVTTSYEHVMMLYCIFFIALFKRKVIISLHTRKYVMFNFIKTKKKQQLVMAVACAAKQRGSSAYRSFLRVKFHGK